MRSQGLLMIAEWEHPKVCFTVDGEAVTVRGALDRRLVDILREDCGHTGVKRGCDIGRCGACMVLVDGAATNACLLMAFQADGTAITTPAGLDAMPAAQIVREALVEEVAFQCGYCAPGFVMSLTALFLRDEAPAREAILTALEGNICRCTGYHSILRGAERAARKFAALRNGAAEGQTP
ncbi:carbon-monoxide dehydrogenase small subunit [Kaistia soli DSM 19436]|uniref:Carbon-monoxide dehydrogenase small subunit n=1 Tax=Kaistia soli DSM 19436 TaxID=1122133 RepID=A0A1M5MFT2_9HYPH|nr:(2Fe-2S)-binding protein [Kaistia soli]SHG76106.1 carbon-monoxide dehydrogenase small subunit [Kaistia soli DSM 19436]